MRLHVISIDMHFQGMVMAGDIKIHIKITVVICKSRKFKGFFWEISREQIESGGIFGVHSLACLLDKSC